MKKNTAVEWLLQQIENKNGTEFSSYYNEFIEQAKEIEKQQIIDAWVDGNDNEPKETTEHYAKQYFNQTYKGGENV